MTVEFGRRNRAPAPAPAPTRAVLTPERRAHLFADDQPETEKIFAGATAAARLDRRAGLIACAALTAVTVALGAFGKHDVGLQGTPSALEPMGREFLALIGPNAGAFVLGWTVLLTSVNFSANLWLSRKLAVAFSLTALPAFAAVGAVVGFAMAWVPDALGLGASEIGLSMEALAGAGLSAFYRLLAGPARL